MAFLRPLDRADAGRRPHLDARKPPRPRTCSPARLRRPASAGSSAGPDSSCSRATARRGDALAFPDASVDLVTVTATDVLVGHRNHRGRTHLPHDRRRADLDAARKSRDSVLRERRANPPFQGVDRCAQDSPPSPSLSPLPADCCRDRRPPPRRRSPPDPATATARDDAGRSGRPLGHRLQLRHRARARRAQPAAADRQLRPAVHGHRRHRQSGHGALPLADRARRARRARTELRVRPARTGKAAAEVRRPRGHAGARRARTAGRRARKKSARSSSATTTDRCGRSATRSSPACTPITSASPSCPATCTAGRR